MKCTCRGRTLLSDYDPNHAQIQFRLAQERQRTQEFQTSKEYEQLRRAMQDHKPKVSCLFEGLPTHDELGRPQFYMLACPCPKCRPQY